MHSGLTNLTLHNEQAFANRMSPSGCQDKVFMKYAWLTCQQVSQVIMPHNPMVTVSVCVCTHACTQYLHIVDQTQTAKAGEEPLRFLGTRGRWTKSISATSTSGADKQVVEELVTEMEILEDEVDMHAVQDQRGDTKYTYKVSVGVLRKSCCVCSRMGLCHCNIILINYPNLCSTWLVLNWAKLLEVESS